MNPIIVIVIATIGGAISVYVLRKLVPLAVQFFASILSDTVDTFRHVQAEAGPMPVKEVLGGLALLVFAGAMFLLWLAIS